jgi:photosystem II stability/assembly factor-like uncharacterized protein
VTGQCVHKLVMAPDEPETLYQQNHCGVYRSSNGGRSWEEIDTGLSSEFGFVFGAHPRDPKTGWVIPLSHPEEGRVAPDGRLTVWRTSDRGDHWVRSDRGLPPLKRVTALVMFPSQPSRLFAGTDGRGVFVSVDGGRHWQPAGAAVAR